MLLSENIDSIQSLLKRTVAILSLCASCISSSFLKTLNSEIPLDEVGVNDFIGTFELPVVLI